MSATGDALWEINNEYRKRLSLLMGHMKLLEQLLKMQGNAEPALRAAIRRVRATLEDVDADHHEWRHRYFYRYDPGAEKRRMVGDDESIMKALRTFSVMLSRHLNYFDTIIETLDDLPRPDPTLTRVIKGGDLWAMCRDETESLATYDQFVNEQFSHRDR
jgi:hypothetical protein